jgi:hypothetical protein
MCVKLFFFLFGRLASALGDQPPSNAPTLLSFPAVESISDPSPGTNNTAPTKGGSFHCYRRVLANKRMFCIRFPCLVSTGKY